MRRGFLVLACTLAIVGCGSSVASSAGGESGDGGASSSAATSGAGGSSGDGGGPSCDDPPSPDTFELGSGETCFERVTTDQIVNVMAGPQGGYHVWAAIGCDDCAANAVVGYGVKDPATGTWFDGTLENKGVVQLDPAGWHQVAGLIAFLPGAQYDPDHVLAKGSKILLVATVYENGQPKHTAEVELVLGDTVYWSPPCDPGPSCGQPGGDPCCTDGPI